MADFENPKWEKPTEIVVKDNKTIEVSIEGYDDNLSESLSKLTENNIEIYLGDTLNSTVNRELKNIKYTPIESSTKTKVTATLVIGENDGLEDYSGPITIKIKPGTLLDTQGNASDLLEYTTTKVVDFVGPTVTITEQEVVDVNADCEPSRT